MKMSEYITMNSILSTSEGPPFWNLRLSGLLEGHAACSKYLENAVGELLLHPANLDDGAQSALLKEVKPVFTEKDTAKIDILFMDSVLFRKRLEAFSRGNKKFRLETELNPAIEGICAIRNWEYKIPLREGIKSCCRRHMCHSEFYIRTFDISIYLYFNIYIYLYFNISLFQYFNILI